MTAYICAALWSINERLGGGPGLRMPHLGWRWLWELFFAAKKRLARERERERQR